MTTEPTRTRVVTWQTANGDKINISREQSDRLALAGTWPRNARGEEYCQVSHGEHYGWSASDTELGL